MYMLARGLIAGDAVIRAMTDFYYIDAVIVVANGHFSSLLNKQVRLIVDEHERVISWTIKQ
jgi:hypothetical protein